MNQSGATLQALLQFALPLGTTLEIGSPEVVISWAVTVRAQPPAFPEIYGGELALVSMHVLRSYESRITLADVVRSLAQAGVHAVAADDAVDAGAISMAAQAEIALLALPAGAGLTRVERAVTTLIVNAAAQLNQRVLEIQRQLTRLAAENRDLDSLMRIIARATARPVLAHDDAGVLIAQVYPAMAQGGRSGRAVMDSLAYESFQRWLGHDAPKTPGVILASPLGHTTALAVEKRVAGYLSLVADDDLLEDFDRLVLTYGADVCAIEMAKSRAIASAVEQTRGDWVQMWLSGTPADDDLMTTRAQQAGFDVEALCALVTFGMLNETGLTLPLEPLATLARDDMARRGLSGAVGLYVDVVVALYPLDRGAGLRQLQGMVEEVRAQLETRSPGGRILAGISHPAAGLTALRNGYREAQDALRIAEQLGTDNLTTFYGDLKLYQLLLALKQHNVAELRDFYDVTLGAIAEHDERRDGDLLRTLEGFFAAKGNLAKAANDLNVHRNTLVYRLERIGELAEMDLDEADNRLILHLALKIQRVLATLPE